MVAAFVKAVSWNALCVLQLKERYTSMRPYGEWLAQETVSLQQLVDSVPEELLVPPPVVPAPTNSAASSNGNGSHALVNFPDLNLLHYAK